MADSAYRSVIANAVQINGWVPTPDLNRTDADVTLMILAQNSVLLPIRCMKEMLAMSISPTCGTRTPKHLSASQLKERSRAWTDRTETSKRHKICSHHFAANRT